MFSFLRVQVTLINVKECNHGKKNQKNDYLYAQQTILFIRINRIVVRSTSACSIGVYILSVKDNILITIKNKTASPTAKPPLLPILLTSLGEAASTTKNQKLRTKNYQAPSAFLKCFVRANLLSIIIRHYSLIIRNANRTFFIRHFQEVKNKWDKWDKWDSGVSLPTIYCLLSRYKAPVAGWNGQTISNVWPTSTQKKWATSGPEAGQVGQLNDC